MLVYNCTLFTYIFFSFCGKRNNGLPEMPYILEAVNMLLLMAKVDFVDMM